MGFLDFIPNFPIKDFPIPSLPKLPYIPGVDELSHAIAQGVVDKYGPKNINDVAKMGSSTGPRRQDNINRVPNGATDYNDNTRKVYIGSRLVGGIWANQLPLGGLAALSRAEIQGLPNPSNHWSVIVGDFYHQLQATSLDGGWNYYENDKKGMFDNWKLFEIEETRYNDVAIVYAATQAMNGMPEKYNLIAKNCQTFALRLCDLICRPGRAKVYTSYSGDTRLLSYVPGDEKEGETKAVDVAVPEDDDEHLELLKNIDKILTENTPMMTEEEIKAATAS